MEKITIPVSGMHCASCEMLLEKSIKKVKNVTKVEASEKKWLVEVTYDTIRPNTDEIETIIKENGYRVGVREELPWLSANREDYTNTILAAIIVIMAYTAATVNGWSFGSIGNTASPTLGVALLIGLTAGISSCMALIGGLVLGISAKWNKEHENAPTWTRFAPHLHFHLGRVIGFAILWGILGFFGSIIHFSNIFLGFTTVLVGIVMLLLGANLTNLSPKLGSFSPKLPKFLGENVNGEWSSRMAIFLTGAATFFLPCGFTLAMQVYAVSTGSFATGALVMALFALGTVPGLLSLGFVSAILKGEWLKKFLAFTGVIVLALGIFNVSNGYALLSLGSPAPIVTETADTENLEIQEVRMTEDDSGYSPNILTIDAGKKIRWIITGKNPYSCASQIIVPSLWISKSLKSGENIIEFVAPASGEIAFSCSMGMYRGKFVINANGKVSESDNIAPVAQAQKASAGGGCSMMGGNSQTNPTPDAE